MILTASLLGLWLAALIRLVIGVRHVRRVWRTTFDVAVFCVATACTLLWFSSRIDRLLGVMTIGTTLGYVALNVAAGAAANYVECLRHRNPRRGVLRANIAAAVAVNAVSVGSWAVSPLPHLREQPHGALSLTTAVYVSSTHAWVAYVCYRCAHVAVSGAWRTRGSQAPGLALIGVGCFIAGSICAVELGVVFAPDPYAAMRGTGVVQWAGGAFLALGVTCLAAVPAFDRWRSNRRDLRVITPLWGDLARRVPHVVLPASRRPGHGDAAILRAQIEILDALETIRIDARTPSTVEAVAAALKEESVDEGVPAIQRLPEVSDRAEDLRRTLSLARAYQEA